MGIPHPRTIQMMIKDIKESENNMPNTDAYINYLLDRSGSMGTIWEKTVEGFNAYKNEQAQEDGTAWITLTAFDATSGGRPDIEVVFDAVRADECPDLTDQVAPRGMTPYYDALGQAIESAEAWLKTQKTFNGQVFIVINTDGYENASKEYTAEALKARIETKEKDGWTFVFMGAGIDAINEAQKIGIDRQHTHSYAAAPAAAMTANMSLSAATRSARKGQDFSWDDEMKKSGTKSR